jgi:hypothetical protein
MNESERRLKGYQEAVNIWQDLYPDRKLTLEDGEEITRNITGFFNTLIEWDKKGEK